MFLRHPFLSLVTAAYLGVVAWITLGPQPVQPGTDGVIWRLLAFFGRHNATSWIGYSTVEFVANVLMFLPIGLFFLLLLGRRLWWLAVLFGVVLTLGIEGAQLFIPARVSDVRDLVANSTGGFIGVLSALMLTHAKARRIRLSRQFAARAHAVSAETVRAEAVASLR